MFQSLLRIQNLSAQAVEGFEKCCVGVVRYRASFMMRIPQPSWVWEGENHRQPTKAKRQDVSTAMKADFISNPYTRAFPAIVSVRALKFQRRPPSISSPNLTMDDLPELEILPGQKKTLFRCPNGHVRTDPEPTYEINDPLIDRLYL